MEMIPKFHYKVTIDPVQYSYSDVLHWLTDKGLCMNQDWIWYTIHSYVIVRFRDESIATEFKLSMA